MFSWVYTRWNSPFFLTFNWNVNNIWVLQLQLKLVHSMSFKLLDIFLLIIITSILLLSTDLISIRCYNLWRLFVCLFWDQRIRLVMLLLRQWILLHHFMDDNLRYVIYSGCCPVTPLRNNTTFQFEWLLKVWFFQKNI